MAPGAVSVASTNSVTAPRHCRRRAGCPVSRVEGGGIPAQRFFGIAVRQQRLQ